jgi:hypothetical protein
MLLAEHVEATGDSTCLDGEARVYGERHQCSRRERRITLAQLGCSRPESNRRRALGITLLAGPSSVREARISTIDPSSDSGSSASSFWAFSRVVIAPILTPKRAKKKGK